MKSKFRRLFPSGEAEPFFASLDEARAELEAAEGPARARRWHRRQLLRSLPGLAADSIAWRLHMLASDLKVARRSLAKRTISPNCRSVPSTDNR